MSFLIKFHLGLCNDATIIWNGISNETAGHHRHNFRPQTLLQIPFRRIKAFFLKNTVFSKLWYSSKYISFLISAKKLRLRWKKRHFCELMSFETHLTAKLLPQTVLKKVVFSSKKLIYFSKKIQVSFVLRNLTLSVTFYGKFAVTWWKKFKDKTVEFRTLLHRRTLSIGK